MKSTYINENNYKFSIPLLLFANAITVTVTKLGEIIETIMSLTASLRWKTLK